MDWTVILFTFLLVILVSPACIDRVACQQTAANNGTNCRLQRARGIRGRCYVLMETPVVTNDARALCIRRGGLVPQFGSYINGAFPRVNVHPTATENDTFNEMHAFFAEASLYIDYIPYGRDGVYICDFGCPPTSDS